MVHQALTMLAG